MNNYQPVWFNLFVTGLGLWLLPPYIGRFINTFSVCSRIKVLSFVNCWFEGFAKFRVSEIVQGFLKCWWSWCGFYVFLYLFSTNTGHILLALCKPSLEFCLKFVFMLNISYCGWLFFPSCYRKDWINDFLPFFGHQLKVITGVTLRLFSLI